MSEIAERYFEKALTAIRGRDNGHALALLVEAIKLKPNFSEAWVVRGNVLHSVERHFDALLHYDRALSIDDTLHDAWNNRGLAFGDLGMWSSAEECFRKSAELLPAIEPHMGLANMFCTIMRLEDAAAEYRAAVAIDNGCFEAHFNLGVTLLGLGRWEEGFREYEWRWDNTPYPPRAYRDYPKWRGEDLAGKRILLYPEQGYGDEIMALRFALSVARKYPDAVVMVQPRTPMMRLTELMCRTIAPVDDGCLLAMTPHDPLKGIAIDFSCPLLDVPAALGPRIVDPSKETWLDAWAGINAGPYLTADTALTPWRPRLNTLPPGLNVGLCWSSGGHLNTARAAQQAKSIPVPLLKPLVMPGVNLISLQKPREPTPREMGIHDWTDEIHDFADTAALIEALDLVISVDTSVAHLAGALGKPVWNFVRFSGYWPWLAPDVAPTPEHAIWYPSMRLLRQRRLADWSEPIATAKQLLTSLVEKKAA